MECLAAVVFVLAQPPSNTKQDAMQDTCGEDVAAQPVRIVMRSILPLLFHDALYQQSINT